MRCKNRKYHWPIELKGCPIRNKHLNFVIRAIAGFPSGLLSPLKYSIKDNHLRYTLSTCLQFEYKKKCNFLNGLIRDWTQKYSLGAETSTMSVFNLRYAMALQGGWVVGEAILWHKGQAIDLAPWRNAPAKGLLAQCKSTWELTGTEMTQLSKPFIVALLIPSI